jgi:nitroreductase
MKKLLKLIRTRQSARVLFDPERFISKKNMNLILEAGSWAPTAHNMQNFETLVVTDKKILKTIASIGYPTSLAFVRENYKQLSFSIAELKKRKTGVLGTTFPPAWRKPGIKAADLRGVRHNDFMEKEIISSSALVLVLYDPGKRAPASEGDFLGIISLGCVMENMWLMAHSLEIGFHILSALSAGPVEKKIKQLLHIPKHLMIAISFRLGYPVSPVSYLRVRRDVSDFNHFNSY